MMRTVVNGLFVGCTLMMAAPLAAQEHRAWPERVWAAIDVPFQPLNNGFSESLSFADAVRKNENVTFDADYHSSRGVLFDVGIGVRLTSSVGVGVASSWFERSSSASFNLAVPNPLAANRPLNLSGSVGELNRRELGTHIQALWGFALGGKGRVIVGGGPSVFKAKQDLVRSIEFDTLPGFTSLKFNQAIITESERSVVGFNVGADVTWAFASHLGVGSLTRYSRASVTFDPGSESGVSRAIKMHAGGLQLGGGIRLLF